MKRKICSLLLLCTFFVLSQCVGLNQPHLHAAAASHNTWSFTGNISTPRTNHTATLLLNQKVLVAGGDGSNGYLASAELYDPATGTWSPTGSMSTPRQEHTATLLSDGIVLVVGGDSSETYLRPAQLYDPRTGSWSVTSSMPLSSGFHTLTLLSNGKVLATGEHSSTSSYGTTASELYDPLTAK